MICQEQRPLWLNHGMVKDESRKEFRANFDSRIDNLGLYYPESIGKVLKCFSRWLGLLRF